MNSSRQHGFSLVELMVGLVIGLIVSGIVITTFMQSKRSYTQDEMIGKLQENGRFALQLLSKEISMAGFAGNMQIEDTILVKNTGSFPISETNVCDIEWWKISDKPISILPADSAPGCITGVKSGTNIVISRRVEGKSEATPAAEKIYFRTNGRGGEIHVSDGTATPANYTDWPYIMYVYYIKGSDTEPDGLYRKSLIYTGTALTMTDEENIVPGLFGLGSLKGVDLTGDGTANQYVSTTGISDLVTVKLDILMSSETEDHTYNNEKTYTLGGDQVNGPGSKYYGRVFSTTIPVRNAAYRIQMENIGEERQ